MQGMGSNEVQCTVLEGIEHHSAASGRIAHLPCLRRKVEPAL